ncbi:U11/U12 small nuclear ribonucleoprotein 59 kDa protein [Physcomitrium patens]|uniref:Uncharacterized protein n=1 Tax=Physcomitrium patens TaxID=3218 RepID=A9SRX9_PHYPA|nr:U11/U12 small nuclear ribonucleoprotein 59 kDa protein-like isoform X1 [Physcomitrium patens]PNR55883.1 hypothetical protein PHYPA_006780 [Physcomitrium patens]|eukprot:XP_024373957.1 U11/U12 small nuclear ribonucleoprotein 59 kDa protein-like isoform X1 [Physcomitrella patens]
MYSSEAPPLPPGRSRELAQAVVPADFSVKQLLWQNSVQLRQHLRELLENAALLKAVATELEIFESRESLKDTASTIKECVSDFRSSSEKHERLSVTEIGDDSRGVPATEAPSMIQVSDRSTTLNKHAIESLENVPALERDSLRAALLSAVQTSGGSEAQTVEAALELQNRVTNLLAPLEGALGAPEGWEHAAAAARLRTKRDKIQRSRRWRKRKRQRIAETHRKEQESFEEADHNVDEWRAREIAKSIARSKMEKMKEVAEKKAKEDRARLEAELEMVLMVEKLQELRALRIQKLKKQGCFFPDEDDKFMDRVRAAVQEEERQAAAAADFRAAAAAIAIAAKAAKVTGQVSTASKADGDRQLEIQLEETSERDSNTVRIDPADQNVVETTISSSNAQNAQGIGATIQEAYKLPAEFHHFYYGSQVDLGALIEVRRAWDAYLMPGGSRIPGHWVEAPPPADAIWATYLVQPTSKKVEAEKTRLS